VHESGKISIRINMGADFTSKSSNSRFHFHDIRDVQDVRGGVGGPPERVEGQVGM